VKWKGNCTIRTQLQRKRETGSSIIGIFHAEKEDEQKDSPSFNVSKVSIHGGRERARKVSFWPKTGDDQWPKASNNGPENTAAQMKKGKTVLRSLVLRLSLRAKATEWKKKKSQQRERQRGSPEHTTKMPPQRSLAIGNDKAKKDAILLSQRLKG